MDRFTWMVLGSAWIVVVTGCSSGTDSSQFKSYKDLLAQDATTAQKPVDDEPAATDTVAMVSEVITADPAVTDDVVEMPTAVSALAPVNVVDGTSSAAVLKVFPSPSNSIADATPSTTNPAETPAAEPKPQGIQLLVPHREFKVEGPQNALRVSYDDLDLLKVLNMEPVPEDALKHFPSWLKALDGQRVRVRGFMYPTFQATGIDQFVLARDNQICCFGRNPKVYDLVSVQMRDGVTTDYIQNRPFDVVGIFRIDLLAEGGKPMGLYWLEDSVVINK
ncbi:MAG: hypothetical protein Q8K78_02475 [Planctomycetaceae bacterium]|nr:hypothetical protein [Planctomycetaceae bacterium]